MSLIVPVNMSNLQDALESYVKYEVLEGDNALLCANCQKKVILSI